MHRQMLRPIPSLLLLAMFAWGDLGAPLADATAFHRSGRGPDTVQAAPGGIVGVARHLAACQLDSAWGAARTPMPAATGAVVLPAPTCVLGAVETRAVLLPRRSVTCLSRAPPAPLA